MYVLAVLLLLLGVLGVLCEAPDWLVTKIEYPVEHQSHDDSVTLTNGLISRTFRLYPDFGTVDFRSEVKGKSLLRAINPEARVTLDGFEYAIGGLQANVKHDFLNRSAVEYTLDPNAFHLQSYSFPKPEAPFHWVPGLRHSPNDSSWPPEGLGIRAYFKAPASVRLPQHANVIVTVTYLMYKGIPLISKSVGVLYDRVTPVQVDGVTVEYLATQKPYTPFSRTAYPEPWDHNTNDFAGSWLYVESSEYHGSRCYWSTDPELDQSPGADELLVGCSYSSGPGVIMGSTPQEKDGQYWDKSDDLWKRMRTGDGPPMLTEFESFQVLELVVDSDDRERVGLSRHRMTRLLTPQMQENPIFLHCTNSTPAGFRAAVDQMSKVGFEMYIYSFGSGFQMENTTDANLEQIAEDVRYAKSFNIEVGGYDLICLARGDGSGRNVGDQWDVIDPDTHKLGPEACFASGWYDKIQDIFLNMVDRTGLSMVETDGPYGGAPCEATNHSHHLGLEDSVYWQSRLQGELYAKLKERNVFINTPDTYFFQGGNKDGMGYNEWQYSLPRWEDLSVSRQGMYDDTYRFIPTQGWMFVPLVQYHGGGSAAMFEPLSEHLLEYEWALAQYLGYGVAACYRGPQLYDSEESYNVVLKWVTFYKQYRDILTSDIVHVRRPDMQDIDCILHVNPNLNNRGLAMVFNPTSDDLTRNLTLPLYYTGITEKASVLHEGQLPGQLYQLERDYSITVPLTMKAKSITWYLVLLAV